MEDKTLSLKQIKDDIVNLEQSPLYKERIESKAFPVIGEGNHDADIMFIGEAPGRNEAKYGKPFCGRAGIILDELLSSINLKRKNIYITNIVKDRPPNNRSPKPEEIDIYAPFLDRQIEIICPKIIVTLGRFSSHYLLKKFKINEEEKPMGEIHGIIFRAKTNHGTIKIIPLFHPASVIYDNSKKQILLEGFLILKDLINKLND